jgi:8-oxo-dGTP pyrophosphatase MutT (NUDIX family)
MAFPDAAAWYQSLATVYGTAAALITSPDGKVLLVKPNYRPGWGLPGGSLEDGEAPSAGCAREVKEELGLDLPIGPLLLVAWIPPEDYRPRPIVAFLFDGGVHGADDLSKIVLQESELDEYRLVPPGSLSHYVRPELAERLIAALLARSTGAPAYFEEPA